jgi:predicted DNA-binding transcriptional regulator AlpA
MTNALEPTVPDLAALAALPEDATVDMRVFARMLFCSPRHVWRLVDDGLAPAPLRIGRLCRWRVGTLRDWIRGGCKPVTTTGSQEFISVDSVGQRR